MTGVIAGFLSLGVLLPIGMHIGLALALAGLIGMAVGFGPSVALSYLSITPYREAASFSLAAIPLYLIMGHVAVHSGMSRALIDLAYRWVGRLRGGLAMALIVAAAIFAAVTGSSSASAAALGSVIIPEVERYRYDRKFILACVAASGTFAIMIPPSITLIVYGILTETSIGKLFAAGFVPGVISAAIYIVTVAIVARLKPSALPRGPQFTWKERWQAFRPALPVFVLVVLVLGGIYGGVFTPTEAGAVGAFGATSIAAVMRRLNRSSLVGAAREAARSTAMIFLIIIGAFIFGHFMALYRVPQNLALTVAGLPLPPMGILLLVMLIYIFLGTFMDQLAIQVLTIPILFPVMTHLGFDPLWFGILFTKTVEIGLITPPVGLNIYVLSSTANVPIEEAFSGILPFFVADVLTLGLLVLFPQITLWLPSQMG